MVRFLQQGTPDDEYFLITFNERTALVGLHCQNETSAMKWPSSMPRDARRCDTIYLGLQKLTGLGTQEGPYRYHRWRRQRQPIYFSDVKEFAKESAPRSTSSVKGDQGYGRAIIQRGRKPDRRTRLLPNSLKTWTITATDPAELRNQYVLGYTPANSSFDGQWRKSGHNSSLWGFRLNVHSREGYFSPKR